MIQEDQSGLGALNSKRMWLMDNGTLETEYIVASKCTA